MSRHIVQHHFVTPEVKTHFNPDNVKLAEDFSLYSASIDKSPATIVSYACDLNFIWFWNLMYNDNKYFVNWTKSDIIRFQNWCLEDCQHSSARIHRLKSTLASLSNYVENIRDDEFPDFRKIVRRIPNPPKTDRLTKSVFEMKDINQLLGQLTFQGEYEKACCLALAVCSGRRKAELLRFRISDFTEEHIVCNGALYKSSAIRTKGSGRAGKPLYQPGLP